MRSRLLWEVGDDGPGSAIVAAHAGYAWPLLETLVGLAAYVARACVAVASSMERPNGWVERLHIQDRIDDQG